MKTFFIIVIIILIIICIFNINTIKANFSNLTIKDIKQHPQSSIYKNVVITGQLVGGLDRIKSDNGYIIILNSNCFERNIRVYSYNKYYTATGYILPDESLSCFKPIE